LACQVHSGRQGGGHSATRSGGLGADEFYQVKRGIAALKNTRKAKKQLTPRNGKARKSIASEIAGA
jgi:hypothetical protein